jgi:hypothetical protein
MNILYTDQPGRIFAVFVIAPIIAYKGYIYNDLFLVIFSILLLIWDSYWLLYKEPKVRKHNII